MDIYLVRFWFIKGYYFDDGSNIVLGKTWLDQRLLPLFAKFDNFLAFLERLVDPGYENPGFQLVVLKPIKDDNLLKHLYDKKRNMNLSSIDKS